MRFQSSKQVMIFFIVMFFVYSVKAEKMKTTKYLYYQDFQKQDPIKFWTSNKKYTVNYKGLTSAKEIADKKVYKLDVSTKGRGYFYWSIELEEPIAVYGKLKFEMNALMGKKSKNIRFGIGLRVKNFNTLKTGCSLFSNSEIGFKKAQWTHYEYNKVIGHAKFLLGLAETGIYSGRILSEETQKSLPAAYIDRIGLFLFSNAAQARMVLYIKDIKISGQYIPLKKYKAHVNLTAQKKKKKIDNRIEYCDSLIKEKREELNSIKALAPIAKIVKQGANSWLNDIAQILSNIKKSRKINYQEDVKLTIFEKYSKYIKENIDCIKDSQNQNFVTWIVPPITNVPILPTNTYIKQGYFNNILSLTAARNERETISFVITAANENIEDVSFQISPLKDKKGNHLKQENIALKIVKCWYQDDNAWNSYRISSLGKRKLIPELLLNNDTLVKINNEKKDNYIYEKQSNGKFSYKNISSPVKIKTRKIYTAEEFSVNDSKHLLPVTIKGNQSKQFWLTINVPAGTEPGLYIGTIAMLSQNKNIGNLKMELRVLPFSLPQPTICPSIYYRGILSQKNIATISSEGKSEEQLREDLLDMKKHNILNPTVYQSYKNKTLLEKVLKIRKEVGIVNMPLYYTGLNIGYIKSTKQNLEQLKKDVKDVIRLAKQYGNTEVFFFGRDEAYGSLLKEVLPAYKEVKAAGGKVIVAISIVDGTIEIIKGIVDIAINAGSVSADKVATCHKNGIKLWSYDNPQSGPEDPRIHRRNFGLLLWRYNYDGFATYAYQDAFGCIWNDFDSIKFRGLNYAYPTATKPIDTLAFVGVREGVDDIRYVELLEEEIRKVENSNDNRLKKTAKSAQNYLNNIQITENINLRNIRTEIINWILQLKGEKLQILKPTR